MSADDVTQPELRERQSRDRGCYEEMAACFTEDSDDSIRMAARARAVGVSVVLDITADVPHVFQSFAGVLDEADEALERASLFLTQHVRGPEPAAVSAR
ncbi:MULTISPECIES: hypothetical protein [Streptomyces]|uniref:Uncharacterized protein n=1 Tax=Streptomyces chengmaiensis TaxID=3040919 RepID=A0ABT6HGQ3_9ACTN|nr:MULTISPECIES: hypothetical protein [Streptomyces]MDH2387944.1 hypothetical protein [Streptomyces chengmaiensis]WRQ79858.1 hypothetical protein I3F59_011150 [Streptomyces sp. MUM 178J]